MQTSEHKQKRTSKIIAWLQIAVGVLILSLAVYRYVSHDYDLKAVNIGVTLVLGLIIPIAAIVRIIHLNREEKQLAEQNTWQEPEIL